jgi:hypothetical protein
MPSYDFMCPKCNGAGGTYLDSSLTDKMPCKVCGGSGERRFKVIKGKHRYEVIADRKFSLRSSCFRGTYLDCKNYADVLNNSI